MARRRVVTDAKPRRRAPSDRSARRMRRLAAQLAPPGHPAAAAGLPAAAESEAAALSPSSSSSSKAAALEAFGLLELRALYSADERRQILEEAEVLLATSAVERHDAVRNTGGVSVEHSVERSPLLTRLLLEDGRITSHVAEVLGRDFIWSGSELERSADTSHHDPDLLRASGLPPTYNEHNWHSDRHGVREIQYPRLKLMMYLTPTDRDGGALRILPGSHRAPYHHRLSLLQAAPGLTADKAWADSTFGTAGAELPAHIFEAVEPCDSLAMQNPLQSIVLPRCVRAPTTPHLCRYEVRSAAGD